MPGLAAGYIAAKRACVSAGPAIDQRAADKGGKV